MFVKNCTRTTKCRYSQKKKNWVHNIQLLYSDDLTFILNNTIIKKYIIIVWKFHFTF